MPRTTWWADDCGVDDKTVTIGLEIRLAGDSVTGRASCDTGAARDFAGWIGLVAAIDALVSDTKEDQRWTSNPDGEAP
jgi:hypothetical protein